MSFDYNASFLDFLETLVQIFFLGDNESGFPLDMSLIWFEQCKLFVPLCTDQSYLIVGRSS